MATRVVPPRIEARSALGKHTGIRQKRQLPCAAVVVDISSSALLNFALRKVTRLHHDLANTPCDRSISDQRQGGTQVRFLNLHRPHAAAVDMEFHPCRVAQQVDLFNDESNLRIGIQHGARPQPARQMTTRRWSLPMRHLYICVQALEAASKITRIPGVFHMQQPCSDRMLAVIAHKIAFLLVCLVLVVSGVRHVHDFAEELFPSFINARGIRVGIVCRGDRRRIHRCLISLVIGRRGEEQTGEEEQSDFDDRIKQAVGRGHGFSPVFWMRGRLCWRI
jgi:hypothetical protein